MAFLQKQRRKLPSTREVIEFGIRPHRLRWMIKHVHGPHKVSYAGDELLVITVVRNGELHVESFMEHYLSLGVKHLVFLDNGSTDRTVEMLCAYDKVTVLRTDAPFAKYENTMKRYLVDRFSRGRWNLCADIDELFDYPYSEVLSLRDFLGYLNHNRFTAVVTQMLDMFSDGPLGELESSVDDRLTKKYVYYDISVVRKTKDQLFDLSEASACDVMIHADGIRKTIFGTNNGLTKTALVFIDERVKTFVHWHLVRNALIADSTCVLKHYPFVSSFYAKVQDAATTGRYGNVTTDEYKAYWEVLKRNPNLSLKTATARRFTGLEQLIEEEFLVVSNKYRHWANAHARGVQNTDEALKGS